MTTMTTTTRIQRRFPVSRYFKLESPRERMRWRCTAIPVLFLCLSQPAQERTHRRFNVLKNLYRSTYNIQTVTDEDARSLPTGNATQLEELRSFQYLRNEEFSSEFSRKRDCTLEEEHFTLQLIASKPRKKKARFLKYIQEIERSQRRFISYRFTNADYPRSGSSRGEFKTTINTAACGI